MMKYIKRIAACIFAAALVCSLGLLVACGGGLTPPKDFEFALDTREYSFATVADADTYQITVEKILNEATGKAFVEGQSIEREEKGQIITQPAGLFASLVTMPGSNESKYVWTSTVNNTMSIKDTSGSGKVNGKLYIYQHQSRADGVTPVLLDPLSPTNPDEMPLGHYYVSCYSLDKDGNRSEPAWKEIIVGGKLADPDFGYTVEGDKMKVSITSSYIDSAMRTEGLPEKIDVEVNDGSSTQTVTFDNWAYYTTVIGPDTTYNYMFLEKEITVKEGANYSVKATARGDGDKIKDSDTVSLVSHMTASPLPLDYLGEGTTVELTGTTSDGMTVAMTVNKATGKWAIEGRKGSGKYYGATWGTYAEGENGVCTVTVEGGDGYATVSSFTITEKEDNGDIKKASATVSVSGTSVVGGSADNLSVSYEKRGGGWGPGGPGGPGGPM